MKKEKTIRLSHYPFEKMLRELAKKLDTNCIEKFGEYILKLPQRYGQGIIRGINFSNGLGMIQYNCTFNQETNLIFEGNGIHPLRFVYSAKNKILHRLQSAKIWNEIRPNRFSIVSTTNQTGYQIKLPQQEKINITSIEVNRKTFQSHLEYDLSKMDTVFYKLLSDENAEKELNHGDFYNFNAFLCNNEIAKQKGDPIIQSSFLHAKSLEMFTHMLEQYKLEIIHDATDTIRFVDMNILNRAEQYVKENYHERLSIRMIARESGTNSTNLQRSFKVVHKKTVNQYLSDYRLDQAKKLLKNNALSVGEIAQMVGIQSRSHFTLMFKSKYGITPKKYQIERE